MNNTPPWKWKARTVSRGFAGNANDTEHYVRNDSWNCCKSWNRLLANSPAHRERNVYQCTLLQQLAVHDEFEVYFRWTRVGKRNQRWISCTSQLNGFQVASIGFNKSQTFKYIRAYELIDCTRRPTGPFDLIYKSLIHVFSPDNHKTLLCCAPVNFFINLRTSLFRQPV